MENLGQIETVAGKIKIASAASVKALHKFIFQLDGDRSNRKRLREFKGFAFRTGSEEYTAKIEYVGGLTVGDLISCCNILGLDYAGSKEELITRICDGLMDINSLTGNQDDDGSDEDENDNDENNDNGDGEDQASVRSHASERSRDEQNNLRFAVSFKDVEDTIRVFDGGDTYPVEHWITDFEEAATMFGWSELQKVIFAKRSLSGLAKLFIQGEGVIKTWKKLKTLLRDEFAMKINSAQLHNMLVKRKMRQNESIQEYYLVMKELASRGDVEQAALFEHVINGIPDEANNKVMLYGAKTVRDFKDRMAIYEETRKKQQQERSTKGKDGTMRRGYPMKKTEASKGTETTRKFERDDQRSELRCYNCGMKGHSSKSCMDKAKGKKCFNCQAFGHVAAECPEKEKSKSLLPIRTSNCINVTTPMEDDMYKEIVIDDVRVHALIDTGSKVSAIKEKVYKNLKSVYLHNCVTFLIGFGGYKTKTLGYLQVVIKIDGEDFPSTVYVVPDDSMGMDAVVGKDILSLAEVKIDRDGITIRKVVPAMFLTHIGLNKEQELKIDHIRDVETRENVKNMIESYEPNKSKTTDIEMRIIVKDEKPISQKPRRLPAPEKDIVDKQINEWIETGIIEPCASEYASPVVVVKKKDGTPRICIDYRKLNRVVEKDKYPLPLIEELLDKLQDAHVFSSIDLKNGFFHVSVENESKKYTAFVTHQGQYQFRKMPFGLCNAPSVFQRFVNHIFRDLVNEGVALLYLDDVIVPAKNEKEGLKRLELVLSVASEYGLEINIKKCKFMQKRIEFLGHVIEAGNLYPSDEKVKAVVDFPEPKGFKDVQSFLGLSGYFRKFIPYYSVIAKPLSDLLRKDQTFRFDDETRTAFNELKKILTRSPVLKIYNQTYETELHTDASKEGYGAVLMQRSPDDGRLHPVYYMSHKTKREEQNYCSYELEALAIVKALDKFRTYLLGIEFKIVTDCAAFQRTMDKKDLIPRIARWALLLEDYKYKIEHRPGVRMKHVDALSRHPVMMITKDPVIPKIKKMQENDAEIKAIFEVLKDRPYENYFVREGLLYKFLDGREVLVVPKVMQTEIIQTMHQKGHFAAKRTEELIKQDYFIPDLARKVERHIANCVACIITNRKQGKQEGFLSPLIKNNIPLYTYHVDHIGPLDSTSKSYNHIFVVIDSFSKFVWLYPVKSTTTREVISKLEIQRKIFGNPEKIVSDRGTAFTSQEFTDYCNEENIKHLLVTTGLPRANGQVERLNRTIIPVLAKLSINDPTKWYRYVDKLQLILNSTFQRSIGMTPFELLFGVKIRDKDDLKLKETIEKEFALQFDEDRDELREKAKAQILKTQEENRKIYDKKRKEASQYKIGDLVAIKRTQLGPGRKLRAKFLGPYEIVKVKSNNTYDVKKSGSEFEGPLLTSTCAEYIKPWLVNDRDSSGSDEL